MTAVRPLLAPTVTVISPLTARFRFTGPDQVSAMMAAAFTVISDIRFHTEVGDDKTRALFYHGRCGREALEEAQLLRFDENGLITELTFRQAPARGDGDHGEDRPTPAVQTGQAGCRALGRGPEQATGTGHPTRRKAHRPDGRPGPRQVLNSSRGWALIAVVLWLAGSPVVGRSGFP
ncbi:hypothetical protein GPZ80_20375 [Actinokineospora sp. HBU206404]|uniref:SnoaL-like domain-containing protein n=1 Tax=Actinokineospora xionganensis TaxID=2684470 RepID=A0ABR7LAY4_9PSEU|nr:hypothetical protein [Actinokineospora xionganensis]